jgi:hypothetical protein
MEENEAVLSILTRDLQDLRAEMREGFYRVHERLDTANGRLDKALMVCSDDCPKKFAGKSDFDTLQKWVKWNCMSVGIFAGVFLMTHGEQALLAFERILKWL